MTLFPRSNLTEPDPAARWLEHYEAVEKQRGAVQGRHRFPPPGLRRRQRAVALLIALAVVLAGAASAVLWL
jgi:hypothetical protein